MDGDLKYTSSLWTNELEPDRRTSADAQRVEISHIWQIRWLRTADKSATKTRVSAAGSRPHHRRAS